MPVDGWFSRPSGGVTGWLTRSGQQRTYAVTRHGEGRKYWEAHYPDGTHVDNFRTMEDAKRSCESWEPDATLVPLVDEATTTVDTTPAQETTEVVQPPADVEMPYRAVFQPHLWDTEPPYTRTVRAEALKNVAVLGEMRSTIEALIREQIAITRTGVRNNWGGYRWGDEPRTWSEIGKALGVSKQAAATRYGDKKP